MGKRISLKMLMKENRSRKKMIQMLVGVMFIGISIAFYRLAGFGVDPFTAMNLSVSSFAGVSFANWQLFVNIMILLVVFFTARNCIGLGSITNMVLVGYIADLLCWMIRGVYPEVLSLGVRVILFFVAFGMISFGIALYMKADMGISPYDSVAVVIETLSKNRISFQTARLISDLSVVLIAMAFCFLSGTGIGAVIGIGTVCNAALNGSAIEMFRRLLE